MVFNTHESFFTRFTQIAVAILLTLSTQVSAKTFFMTEDKPADSYYSNDDIRTEEITGKDQKPAKDFGKKTPPCSGLSE